MEITAKIVELKGKGLYAYIKAPKQKGRYYKLNKNKKVDAHVEFYHDKYIKGITKAKLSNYIKKYEKNKPKSKLKGLRKTKYTPQKKLSNQLNKGITQTTSQDIRKETNNKIHELSKRLLKPLVRDKQLLNIIAKEENLQKIKHRIETRVEFLTIHNELIGKTTAFNKTPTKVKQEMTLIAKTGANVNLLETPWLSQELKNRNYLPYEHYKNGRIAKVKTTFIFRRG